MEYHYSIFRPVAFLQGNTEFRTETILILQAVTIKRNWNHLQREWLPRENISGFAHFF